MQTKALVPIVAIQMAEHLRWEDAPRNNGVRHNTRRTKLDANREAAPTTICEKGSGVIVKAPRIPVQYAVTPTDSSAVCFGLMLMAFVHHPNL
jgi:hypothetical protein